MKFRSLIAAGVAALLVTTTAHAQFNPNALTSEGSFWVTAKPFATPPNGHGVLKGTTPGYGPLDVWCTDYLGALHTGPSHAYTASFTSLSAGAAALNARTVWGSANLENYKKAAFLYSYLNHYSWVAPDYDVARDIHYAIWHFFSGDPAGARPGEAAWAAFATAFYDKGLVDYRWYFVVTDNDPTNFEGGRVDVRHQEFLTYATPEPGTYALLATGLVGLSLAGLRRRKKDVV